jgi:hypothetical protein
VREVSAAPSPTFLLRCGCVVLGILLSASIGVGTTFAAAKPDPSRQRPNHVPKAVKRLWSEYPLNPGRSERSQEPSAREELRTGRPSRPDGSGDGAGTRTSLLLTLAVTMFGLLAVAVLLLARRRVPMVATTLRGMPPRRLALPEFALARPPYSGLRIPWGPKGGQTMSYFRRLRGSGSDDDSDARNESAESSATKFTPYSLRAADEPPAVRSEKQGRQDRPSRPEPVTAVQPPPVAPDDPAAYEHLGEHVTTVLSSADEAAKRLQASATKQAERIRGEAEDYARKTRAAADAYAEQRREGAETQASAITADAEKRAREVRNAAEEQATDMQRDAVRRREALLQESERSEERLRNLLKVFRAMTERLENLVSTPDQASATAVTQPDTSVDDDLTEALAQSRGPSSGGSRARG